MQDNYKVGTEGPALIGDAPHQLRAMSVFQGGLSTPRSDYHPPMNSTSGFTTHIYCNAELPNMVMETTVKLGPANSQNGGRECSVATFVPCLSRRRGPFLDNMLVREKRHTFTVYPTARGGLGPLDERSLPGVSAHQWMIDVSDDRGVSATLAASPVEVDDRDWIPNGSIAFDTDVVVLTELFKVSRGPGSYPSPPPDQSSAHNGHITMGPVRRARLSRDRNGREFWRLES